MRRDDDSVPRAPRNTRQHSQQRLTTDGQTLLHTHGRRSSNVRAHRHARNINEDIRHSLTTSCKYLPALDTLKSKAPQDRRSPANCASLFGDDLVTPTPTLTKRVLKFSCGLLRTRYPHPLHRMKNHRTFSIRNFSCRVLDRGDVTTMEPGALVATKQLHSADEQMKPSKCSSTGAAPSRCHIIAQIPAP